LKSVIRNFTPVVMQDPFVFCGNHITFFIKEWVDGHGEPKKSVAYHIDDVAAKFFSPNLADNNTVRENQSYNFLGWEWRTIHYSLETMQSLEYVPWRTDRHPLDTDDRMYEMLHQFTRPDLYSDLLGIPKKWKYISTPNTGPIVNLFTMTSKVRNRITVDVYVGGNIELCSLSLYLNFDMDNRLQYYRVDFVENVGMVEFDGLGPERTYIIEMYIEDKF